MKKMMFTMIALLTMAAQADAMSYEQARNEALFLTDKMAYELNLTDAQYEAAYEINLDYLMGVTSQYDVFGPYWERRNLDLRYILYSWQWDMFRAATYFYRPLVWDAGFWHFSVYARYPHRDYFFFGRPHFYASYRGGHSWRMNGGRSFYEHRRDDYRPHVRGGRDNHFGMRNGWDRGDYRNNHAPSGSSTRHTVGSNHGDFGRDNANGNRGGGMATPPSGNINNNHGGNNSVGGSSVGSGSRGNVGSGSREVRVGTVRSGNSHSTVTPSRNVVTSTPSVSHSTAPRSSAGSASVSHSSSSGIRTTPSMSRSTSTPSRSVGTSSSGSHNNNGSGSRAQGHNGGGRR